MQSRIVQFEFDKGYYTYLNEKYQDLLYNFEFF